MAQQKIMSVVRRWWPLALIAGLVLALVFVLFRAPNVVGLSSHPRPAQSYAEAAQRIAALQAQESPAMNPVCRLRFMTHGQKVERAIVFVHGYTNCPQQFDELGRRFYALGYNVLIAPLPYHGLADRAAPELARLTAEDLAAYADGVVDIAQGLGDHVTMAGVSAGGVVTAWAAQHRGDIDLAVVMSPAFGVAAIPPSLTTPAVNVFLTLPDSFQWWDPALKERGGLPHAYAAYSTHALAQIMRLGLAAMADARQAAPAAQTILVVTYAGDTSINIPMVYQVAADWRGHGAQLTTYEFEPGLQLDHDFIDPAQPKQRIDVVYPILVSLIAK